MLQHIIVVIVPYGSVQREMLLQQQQQHLTIVVSSHILHTQHNTPGSSSVCHLHAAYTLSSSHVVHYAFGFPLGTAQSRKRPQCGMQMKEVTFWLHCLELPLWRGDCGGVCAYLLHLQRVCVCVCCKAHVHELHVAHLALVNGVKGPPVVGACVVWCRQGHNICPYCPTLIDGSD